MAKYNSKWAGKSCSVEGCDTSAAKRGWCDKHYRRWQRKGTLEVTRILGDDEARFWSKVVKGPDCWLWLGSHDDKGYGWFRLDGRMRRAHIIAYEYLVGPVPEGRELHHECRDEGCVRPGHTVPVTDWEHKQRHKTEDPICKVDGCTRPRLARGFCRTHYERNRVYGDVTRGRLTAAAFS